MSKIVSGVISHLQKFTRQEQIATIAILFVLLVRHTRFSFEDLREVADRLTHIDPFKDEGDNLFLATQDYIHHELKE